MSDKRMTAFVVGATGLIGRHVVEALLESERYGKVRVAVRRSLHIIHPKLQEELSDFNYLGNIDLRGVDTLFCCLGTTIKKAGSQSAFRMVDYTYVLILAEKALKSGVTNFEVVTAMGADVRSKVFYNRVKGELEEQLKYMAIPSVIVFRPSLLLGERKEKRFAETLAAIVLKCLAPLFRGKWSKYRAIAGKDVAFAMVSISEGMNNGYRIIESDEITSIVSLLPKRIEE